MTLPSSEFWFICYDTAAKLYWYGNYNYEIRSYTWSKPAYSLSTIDFQNITLENPAYTTPEFLFTKFPLVIARTHPFDYTFLQTYYPELLI